MRCGSSWRSPPSSRSCWRSASPATTRTGRPASRSTSRRSCSRRRWRPTTRCRSTRRRSANRPRRRRSPSRPPTGLFAGRRRRIRGIPFVSQVDEADCGAASLAMVCRHFGRRVSLARIRELAHTAWDGTSLKGICSAAEALGLAARPYKVSHRSLERLPLPAIVHWEGNHWVVLADARGKRAARCRPGRRPAPASPGGVPREVVRLRGDLRAHAGVRLGARDAPEPGVDAAVLQGVAGSPAGMPRPGARRHGAAARCSPRSPSSSSTGSSWTAPSGSWEALVLALGAALRAHARRGRDPGVPAQPRLRAGGHGDPGFPDAEAAGPAHELLQPPAHGRHPAPPRRARARSASSSCNSGIGGLLSLLQLAAYLGLMAYYSRTLLLVFLATVPLYAGLMVFSRRVLRPLFASLEESYGRYSSQQIDAIKGIEAVKAAAAEEGLPREDPRPSSRRSPARSGGATSSACSTTAPCARWACSGTSSSSGWVPAWSSSGDALHRLVRGLQLPGGHVRGPRHGGARSVGRAAECRRCCSTG